MKDVLIGIDAGTSVIKSVAFDLSGRQIAVAAIPNRYETLPGGGSEQDLGRTWTDAAATLRLLAEKVENLAARTAALAVTAQGDGTWLIDRDGEPVAPGWLWLDARAAGTVERLSARPEDRVRFERTGTGLAACQQGSQMAWMKENTPGLLERATTAFHCKDWLYFRLTGERVTDPSEACFTFGDFRTRDYDDDVIRILGLEAYRRLLPPVIDGTLTRHPLTAAAARQTGLVEGTPVVLGYVDVVCTSIGAGLYDPAARPGCTIIGSTGMHMRLAETADEVVLGKEATGYTMPIPVPGAYAQMHSNMAATLNIDWVLGLARDLLSAEGVERSQADLLARIDGWLAASTPGAVIYQPYVSEAGERGPFIDATARAGFVGLSVRHGFADMVRAVLEGLSLAARDCYAAMGPLPSEIRMSGGAARNPSLRRILASAIGAPVRASRREEAGAAGVAMMAAVGIGVYPSMAACAGEWVMPLLGETQDPDPELAAVYDRVFPAYVDARRGLRPVWRQMAEVQESTR
jgi:erythritol kinase